MRFDNEGFTLIELVISMALSGLLLCAVSGMIFSGFISWNHGMEEADTVQNLRIAMDRITKEIREASFIKVPENTEEPQNWIEMKIPNTDFSGTQTVLYRYDADGKEIERNYQPVASKIEALTVSFDQYPLVGVAVTGKRNDGQVIRVQSKAAPRAIYR